MWGLATPYAASFIGATTLQHERNRRGGTSEPPPNETQSGAHGDPLTGTDGNVDVTTLAEVEPEESYMCPQCLRSFRSKIGLGQHRKRAHPAEANEEIRIASLRPRWEEEEIELLAAEEASAPGDVRAMNAYLFDRLGRERTLEGIKGIRRRPEYRARVCELKEHRLLRGVRCLVDAPSEAVSASGRRPAREARGRQTALDWLLDKREDIIPEMNGGIWIRAAISRIIDGSVADDYLEQWWSPTFPDLVGANRARLARGAFEPPQLSRRRARRRDYRRMQQLWRINMSKAAHKILDGDQDEKPHLPLNEQVAFWRTVLEAGRDEAAAGGAAARGPPLDVDVWSPITEGEVINIRLPRSSAPGLDGLTVRRWMTEVPAIIRATIMNMFMATGRVPPRFRDSRTVLIPKAGDPLDPSNYRPISVASVVLRHFHKILVARLGKCGLIDERQRAFISADGCAENIAALAAILFDARTELKQVHVITLDVRKAFDTVDHSAMFAVLAGYGVPEKMILYLQTLYREAAVRLEVDREFSDPIHPDRGVRQGDPLSPWIFNLIMNRVLEAVPEQVGYRLSGATVGVLAFADDLVLIGSTVRGAQLALERVEEALVKFGLQLAPNKCAAFSLVPSGKYKKLKVLTDSVFRTRDGMIPQLDMGRSMRYLGVRLGDAGLMTEDVDLAPLLERVRRAPLKPQQRIEILKTFVIPRFMHRLVLGRVTHGALRKMDRQVRAALRCWLALPADVPMAFFHAPIGSGGLGVASLESTVPELTLRRLRSLRNTDYGVARVVAESKWAQQRAKWCGLVKKKSEDWAAELYRAVDGYELREAGLVPASTDWLRDAMVHIPSSEWLRYVRVWVNALPTRIRTTRGPRRLREDVLCRAGCGVQETAAHVIQQCFRTHGGRVMRHDAVAATLAQDLQGRGFQVRREHSFRTSVGVRKPDIVASKDGQACVLDVQVVSGARHLEESHKRKRDYYARNDELVRAVSNMFQVPLQKVEVATATLTWRGIWSETSAADLRALGVSRSLMRGLTTRVLSGSYRNFTRFNQTTMARGPRYLRMSGWGPP